MKTAKEILELIENVLPDDTDKLDEIDARVWCYIYKTPFEKYFSISNGQTWVDCVHGSPSCDNYHYTRSRDALKSIRPEGYSWFASANCGIKSFVYHKGGEEEFLGEVNSTEELAELHAIIQAIEWERNNENDNTR